VTRKSFRETVTLRRIAESSMYINPAVFLSPFEIRAVCEENSHTERSGWRIMNRYIDISDFRLSDRAPEDWTFRHRLYERACVTSQLNRKAEREGEGFLPFFGVLHFQQFRADAAAQQSVISAAEVSASLSCPSTRFTRVAAECKISRFRWTKVAFLRQAADVFHLIASHRGYCRLLSFSLNHNSSF